MNTQRSAKDLVIAGVVFGALFLAYNANGREIGSVDSQPNKFAARELLQRHTLTLNYVVGATPQLIERHSFVRDLKGNYRSAYSPLPPILAASIAWPLVKVGALNLKAPLAPNVIAVLAASVLTALAVALGYLTARERTTRRGSLLIAAGLGLGTGLWSQVSQTLWVHETAILGVALAAWAYGSPTDHLGMRRTLVVGIGLAVAGVSRPQLAPLIGVLLLGLYWRSSIRAATAAWAIVVVACCVLMATYTLWFGHPLGPIALLEESNRRVHDTAASFHIGLDGFAGLLISPSRGILIFSPVVLAVLPGTWATLRDSWRGALRWCALAALGQYCLFATYSVWWGGHTYGPRYLLDVLPLMVPIAAAGIGQHRFGPIAKAVAAAALSWSIAVNATGAFCYSYEQWNTDPNDVDRDHARLWSWSDSQIARCWHRGPSPQNFVLFDGGVLRAPRH